MRAQNELTFIRSDRAVSLIWSSWAELEGELRHGGITPGRLHFEAAQYDFLQPNRIVLSQTARRLRTLPKPPFHRAQAFALAEGPLPGGKEIEKNAKRKLIGARVVPGA